MPTIRPLCPPQFGIRGMQKTSMRQVHHNANAQNLLLALEQAAAIVGLHVNAKKTKFMVKGKLQERNITLTLQNGSEIEKADDCKYLGAWISTNEKDISVRKALAREACKSLSSVWRSPLSLEHRLRLFRATVEPVLLYGCGTRTVNQEMLNKLDTRLLHAAAPHSKLGGLDGWSPEYVPLRQWTGSTHLNNNREKVLEVRRTRI